jgi:hypothetical protein
VLSTGSASFNVHNRQDVPLVRVLERLGVRVVFCTGTAATLSNMQQELHNVLRESMDTTKLLFYYAGHGGKSTNSFFMVPNADPVAATPTDTKCVTKTNKKKVSKTKNKKKMTAQVAKKWSLTDIMRAIITQFKGDTVLFIVDACYSGLFCQAVAHANETKQTHGISFSAITSSKADEDSTGAWTFTAAFVHVLMANGRRTYADLVQHIRDKLMSHDNQECDACLDFDPMSTEFVGGMSFKTTRTLRYKHQSFVSASVWDIRHATKQGIYATINAHKRKVDDALPAQRTSPPKRQRRRQR